MLYYDSVCVWFSVEKVLNVYLPEKKLPFSFEAMGIHANSRKQKQSLKNPNETNSCDAASYKFIMLVREREYPASLRLLHNSVKLTTSQLYTSNSSTS